MDSSELLHVFLTATAGVLGACVGSFLNVVIYRLPRTDCQVHKPNRSFCPNCKKQIPWYLNIPIIAWILLGAKCHNCKKPISWRYPAIEALTAVMFVWIWSHFGGVDTWPTAIAYWILIAIFISATFIDLEHMIIPNVLTLGGAAVGIVACALVPTLMGDFAGRPFHAVGWSIFGALVGYGILWAVISMGKVLFGKRSIEFEGQQSWILSEHEGEDNPILEIGEDEKISWGDIFFRDSDRLRFSAGEITLYHKDSSERETLSYESLVFCFDHFFIDDARYGIETVSKLEGKAGSVVMSREAMGFGDAKFEACIGAFLGWKAVPFSLFAGSILGCVVWLLGKCLGKDVSKQLPFGPYLAVGALIWLFAGEEIVHWYLTLARS